MHNNLQMIWGARHPQAPPVRAYGFSSLFLMPRIQRNPLHSADPMMRANDGDLTRLDRCSARQPLPYAERTVSAGA